MAKINRKEHKLLKGLDEELRWVARDSYGSHGGDLFVYSEKPIKNCDTGGWFYGRGGVRSADNKLFKLIQWEDGEPHRIAELIREYESEEAEVRSKQELIEKWESAIESAEFYGKGKEEEIIGYMKDFVSDLKQLDEPEVLSQEWIVDNVSFIQAGRGYVLGSKLQNLLVPKPERSPEVDQHKELLDELNDLYARKNQDYGNSFDESLDEDGLLVLKIRLGDKYKRFGTLINQKNEVVDESMRDTLIDLANYALMGVMWMDNQEEEG